jgi:hypothetical protein
MLLKLLGIAAAIFIFVKATKLGQEQLRFVFNISGAVTTQTELSAIARQIYVDFITGSEDRRLPAESEAFWTDYIGRNMRSQAPGRDCSRDIWNTPYRVRETGGADYGVATGFAVTSAGPDRKFGTADDIAMANRY